MILPQNPYAATLQEPVEYPSKTYRLDRSAGRIIGSVDGIDAVIQAYEKMFDTERFAWVIYTADYGVEFENLIGQDMDFVQAVLGTRIREALLTDDRTVSVDAIDITVSEKESLLVDIRVTTTEGVVTLRKELVA